MSPALLHPFNSFFHPYGLEGVFLILTELATFKYRLITVSKQQHNVPALPHVSPWLPAMR